MERIKLINILNEQMNAAKEFETALKGITGGEREILGNIIKNTKGGGLKTIDNIGVIRRGLLKDISGKVSSELKSKLIDDLVNQPDVIAKYEKSDYNQIKKEFKKLYSTEQADEIAKKLVDKKTNLIKSTEIPKNSSIGGNDAIIIQGINVQGDLILQIGREVTPEIKATVESLKPVETTAKQMANETNIVISDGKGKFIQTVGKNIIKIGGRFLKFIIGKNMLLIVGGIGGIGIIYKILKNKYGNKNIALILEEERVITEWAPCLQELINDKEGILSTSGGKTSVVVQPEEYPKGLVFFIDGTVRDIGGNKSGTWKCKSGQIGISEQAIGNEITEPEMTKAVDTAVNNLDRFVTVGNLNSLSSILTSLKGKTFSGKDAIKSFLELYSESEGGDSFINDVNSVGIKTLGTEGIFAKKRVLALVNGTSTTSPTSPTTGKIGLKNIVLNFDKSGSSGGTSPVKKPQVYHNCQDKGFPYEYGCRTPKAKDLQTCMGMEQRYQTGNFGPLTLAKIKELNYNITNEGITEVLYNEIMSKCVSNSGGTETAATINTANTAEPTNTTQTVEPTNTTTETPIDLYNRLIKEKILVSTDNKNKIVYKGPDLTDEQKKNLIAQLGTMQYELSRSNEDYRKGDKFVFKKFI